MQVLMGPRNPATDSRLPLIGKVFYSIGNLSYLCCAFCTPVFLTIPVLTIWFGIYPIDITEDGAYAFAIYYFVLVLTLTASGNIGHAFRLWLSTISNNMFWFTYLKAFFNVAISKIRNKEVVFKATDKAVSVVNSKSVVDSLGKVENSLKGEEKNNSPPEIVVVAPEGQEAKAVDASDASSSASSAEEEEEVAEPRQSCCGFLKEELGPKALKEKMTGQGKELWMNIIVLVLSLSTAVVGFWTLDVSGKRGGHDIVQVVSVFWAVYNTVPCIFFLHYALFQFKGMKAVVAVGSIIAMGSVTASFVMLLLKSRVVYNFSELVDKSFMFYEAQRSGELVDNTIPWRGDSALLDQTVDGLSLTGGYFDAGDTVKFGLPMAVATSFLAWGLLDFDKGYSASQAAEARGAIKWSTDYFLKAHTGKNEFYAQVGEGRIEHKKWRRPEDMLKGPRVGIPVNASHPGSDVVGSTVAALAASALVFRDVDFAYSEDLVESAEELLAFGQKHRGKYSDVIPDAKKFYESSGFRDDLAWGAMWLYFATEEEKYIEAAKQEIDPLLDEDNNLFKVVIGWDNVAQPACLLLWRATRDEKYKNCVKSYMDYWTRKVTSTPDGLSYVNMGDNSTSLRNAANSAMLGFSFALEGARQGMSDEMRWTYECWGMLQIRYMLGDSGRSYVVGYGKDYPKRVHHRGATCPDSPATCGWDIHDSKVANRHVLHGALVGGPDIDDKFKDDRNDVKQSEVAIDFNAGFTGALARLARIKFKSGFGQCYHGDGFLDFFRVINLPN